MCASTCKRSTPLNTISPQDWQQTAQQALRSAQDLGSEAINAWFAPCACLWSLRDVAGGREVPIDASACGVNWQGLEHKAPGPLVLHKLQVQCKGFVGIIAGHAMVGVVNLNAVEHTKPSQ